jgi:hypothetical protein
VDCYVRHRGTVFWLQVGAKDSVRKPGVYYRYEAEHTQDAFEVVLGAPFVTSNAVRKTLVVLEGLYAASIVSEARSRFQRVPIRVADGLES